MSSTNAVNPAMDIFQAQLETSRRFADAMFNGAEKIDRFLIANLHRSVSGQIRFAQALAMARDPASIADLQTGFLPSSEDTFTSQREIFQIFTEMQNEIGISMQQYAEQLGAAAAANAASLFGSVPGMTDGNQKNNPASGVFSAWESAFRDAAALANRNLDAVRSNLVNAASNVAESVSAAGSAVNGMEEVRKSGGSSRRK